jgi:hypothetical protein
MDDVIRRQLPADELSGRELYSISEGGSIVLARREYDFCILVDERMLGGHLEEIRGADLVGAYVFGTADARAAYLRSRRWHPNPDRFLPRPSGEPRMLSLDLGSMMSATSLHWKGGMLRYSSQGMLEGEMRVAVADDAFEKLWRAFDAAAAWTWMERHDGFVATDGLEWSIRVDYDEYIFATAGYDAFPPFGASRPGAEFKSICRAFSRLAGGLPVAVS